MDAAESHFIISLTVRNKVTRQCPQTTTFEEKREQNWNRTAVPLLISKFYTSLSKVYCELSNRHHCWRQDSCRLIGMIYPDAVQGCCKTQYPEFPGGSFLWQDVPLVECMYLAITRMPGESYRRRFESLLLCSCDVFRALINSLSWFYTNVVCLILFGLNKIYFIYNNTLTT